MKAHQTGLGRRLWLLIHPFASRAICDPAYQVLVQSRRCGSAENGVLDVSIYCHLIIGRIFRV